MAAYRALGLPSFHGDCTNRTYIYTRQLRYGPYTHSQVLKLNTDTHDVETLSNWEGKLPKFVKGSHM